MSTSIRFGRQELGWLEQEAGRRRLSLSEVVRQAVRHEMVGLQSSEKLAAIEAQLQSIEKGQEAIGKFLLKSKSEKPGDQ